LPLPVPPELTVIQPALLDAVHAQPFPATTETLPVPPLALKLPEAGLSEYVHGAP
jgi:hypothetical protein